MFVNCNFGNKQNKTQGSVCENIFYVFLALGTALSLRCRARRLFTLVSGVKENISLPVGGPPVPFMKHTTQQQNKDSRPPDQQGSPGAWRGQRRRCARRCKHRPGWG